MPRASSFFLLASCVALTAGCGGDAFCSEVACISAASVDLRGFVVSDPGAFPLSIETCFGQRCITGTVVLQDDGGQNCSITPPTPGATCLPVPPGEYQISVLPTADQLVGGAVVIVKVTLQDSKGNVLFSGQQAATSSEFQPNGPDCMPTCFQLSAQFMAQ